MKSKIKLHNRRQCLLQSLGEKKRNTVLKALRSAKKNGTLSVKGWDWVVSKARYNPFFSL